ncbi:hypothetical protein R1flu_009870 [Riccia fluitans]|uniref:Uncharacterized protein n=1 Tax=Riccia fluitans TaxID=41844 RepID=A0ABD1Z3D6_9MARC
MIASDSWGGFKRKEVSWMSDPGLGLTLPMDTRTYLIKRGSSSNSGRRPLLSTSVFDVSSSLDVNPSPAGYPSDPPAADLAFYRSAKAPRSFLDSLDCIRSFPGQSLETSTSCKKKKVHRALWLKVNGDDWFTWPILLSRASSSPIWSTLIVHR